MTLVWSKIPLESGPSRRQLQARQPPCRTAMSDTHHIGSARNLWPDASSETGHRCQTAPGSKRQCFINRRRRSRTPGQLLPGGCLARSRPRREPVSSRWPAPASAPRRDERLAGRGPGTTWVRAPCGPRLSDDVQDERLAGARGRVPGRDQVRMHSTGPMSEVLRLGGTSPMSKVLRLAGRGPVRHDPGCRAAHDPRSALPGQISVSAAPSRPRRRWPGDPPGRLTVPADSGGRTNRIRDTIVICLVCVNSRRFTHPRLEFHIRFVPCAIILGGRGYGRFA